MAMLPLKTILWPTDFSEPSYAALDAAVEFAEYFGADLLCLHVLEPPPRNSEWADASNLSVSLSLKKDRDSCERDLEKLMETRFPGRVDVKVFAEIGDVPDRILEFARHSEADLIIIATHGRTGLRRLVFGSVAEQVIRDAHCPVLAIRQENSTNQTEE